MKTVQIARSSIVLGCLILAAGAAKAADRGPTPVRVFVADMAKDLDALIRTQVFEQRVKVQLVTEAGGADYVLTGFAPVQRDRGWRSAWLPAGTKTTSDSISLVRADGELMWALEAPRKNRLTGVLSGDGKHKLAAQIASWLGYLAH